jgi:alkylated DNA repair dioxygenase AlkB
MLSIPGLYYNPDFLFKDEQNELLEFTHSKPWDDTLKRRVQHYGYRYDYRTRKISLEDKVEPIPSEINRIGYRLTHQGYFNQLPDQVIINEYQPGQGIAPHVDCEPCFGDIIATISLGSVYTMDFYNEIGERRQLNLGLGSLLVMTEDARYKWKHGIEARLSDGFRSRGRRVSLTFRNVILE